MKTRSLVVNLKRALIFVTSGAVVLSTTCASDVRKSVVSAGLDFVESSAGIVLENLFPIQDAFTQN